MDLKQCSNQDPKVKRRGSKGFSLFTPLVGTAVLTISIMIAVTMMHNNIRISEGLSHSYSASEQSIGAQSVESAVAGELLRNMESSTKDVLTDGYITAECNSGYACTSEIESNFNNWVTLEDYVFPRIHIGIERRIELSTEYEVVPGQDCPYGDVTGVEECLAEVMSELGRDIVDTTYSNGILEVSMNPSPLRGYPEAFEVELEREDDETKITSDITPPPVTYSTPNMYNYLEATANAFDHFKQNQHQDYSQLCISINSILRPEGDFEAHLVNGTNGNVNLKVEWEDIGRRTGLNLEYKSDEIVVGDPHTC